MICAAYMILPLVKLIIIDIDYFVHAHTWSAAEKRTTIKLLTLRQTSLPLFFFWPVVKNVQILYIRALSNCMLVCHYGCIELCFIAVYALILLNHDGQDNVPHTWNLRGPSLILMPCCRVNVKQRMHFLRAATAILQRQPSFRRLAFFLLNITDCQCVKIYSNKGCRSPTDVYSCDNREFKQDFWYLIITPNLLCAAHWVSSTTTSIKGKLFNLHQWDHQR